ncbi:MAG TPA: RIP metalloprotease RseP [Clostridia bacterium]|nr:RIP metalloprotease RseP [Clostridia bacterium]
MSIVLAILIFGVLILVHELGHFIVAKSVGIHVREFAIGMGPLLWSKTAGETKYSLRLFPIGGFNRMAGMEPGDEDNPAGFNTKSVGKRLAVISAGSVMNIILALVAFIILFNILGVPSQENIVGEVTEQSPAAQAGILPGDRIVAIDGTPVKNWNEVVSVIHPNSGKPLSLTLERNDSRFSVTVTPEYDAENGVGLIGIRQGKERTGFIQAIVLGVKNTVALTVSILVGLVKMITGRIPADVAGPVGIVSILGDVARLGFAEILTFTAVLSLNLGIINLFPIPALDGSRLIFLGIEGLRGKPVAPEKENLIHLIGFALLIMLMVFITYQDILRLVG